MKCVVVLLEMGCLEVNERCLCQTVSVSFKG